MTCQYLKVGGDNLLKFEDWIEYKKLLEYPFVVIKRDEYNEEFVLKRMKDFNKENYSVLNIDNLEDSSTEIRESINNGDSKPAFLDKRVFDYIKKNNLYQ